jgi:hypothetical protein
MLYEIDSLGFSNESAICLDCCVPCNHTSPFHMMESMEILPDEERDNGGSYMRKV